MTLILTKETKPYDWSMLTEGVDRFLNELVANGIPESSLPPDLLGLQSVDIWVGEVLNGGHSQYVGNKGDHAVPNLTRAMATAHAFGMTEWVSIIGRAIDWIKSNPDQAATMTGFTGGISTELELLDKEFYASWQRTKPQLVAAVLAGANVRWIEPEAIREEIRAEALRRMANDPGLRHALARDVAEQCRAWFQDAEKVAFALACGMVGFPTRSILGPLTAVDGSGETFSVFPMPAGFAEAKSGAALRSAAGLRFQTNFPTEEGRVLAEVTNAQIKQAQIMALAFRLPQSVGLRWAGMGRAFHIGNTMLKVMPGAFWLPSKWRILWAGKVWAVKGSPRKTTFLDAETDRQETLTQIELVHRMAEAGLSSKPQAAPRRLN